MTITYLSLGSNLGDRAANLRAAISALPATNLNVRKVSSFYETEPVDYLDQPWFLNTVVEGNTPLPPQRLLEACLRIEEENLRKRETGKGSIDQRKLHHLGRVHHVAELHVGSVDLDCIGMDFDDIRG